MRPSYRPWMTAVAIATVLTSQPVLAQAANFSGTWTLNASASDMGAMKPPKSDVMTIIHRDDRFEWSEVIVMADGSVEKEAWRGKMDGVARPVDGVPGAKVSYRPDGSGRWTSPEGDSDLQGTLSADGKQFKITSTTKWRDGRVTTLRFVYDRSR